MAAKPKILISECFALPLPRDRTAEAIVRSPDVEGEAFGSTHAGFCRSVIAQMLLPYKISEGGFVMDSANRQRLEAAGWTANEKAPCGAAEHEI